MERFFSILRYTTQAFNWIGLIIVLPLMSLSVTVSVFMRYVVQRPIIGADEITGLLMVILFFFALAHCWLEEGHIRSEIIISRLTRKWRLAADIWASLVVLIFTLAFTYALLKHTVFYYRIHRVTLDTDIQLWPFWAVGVLGSFLLLLSILTTLHRTIKKGPDNES